MLDVQVEGPALVAALDVPGRLARSRGVVARGLRLTVAGDSLRVEADDIESAVSVVVPAVLGTRALDGVVTVEARAFVAAVKGASGLVRVEALPGGGVSVHRIDGVASVPAGGAVDDWPWTDAPAWAPRLSWEAAPILSALQAVLPAASGDQARPILAAVLIERRALDAGDGGVRFAATDSYRLHWCDRADGVEVGADWAPLLVPASVAANLCRLLVKFGDERVYLDTRTERGRSDWMVRGSAWAYSFTPVDGDYPNYRALMPEPGAARTVLGVEASVLTAALGRFKGVTRAGGSVAVYVGDGPRVCSRSDSGGAWSVAGLPDAVATGPALVFGVNEAYLAPAVAACGGSVEVFAIDALKPLLIRGGLDGSFRALVMPVRVTALDVEAVPALPAVLEGGGVMRSRAKGGETPAATVKRLTAALIEANKDAARAWAERDAALAELAALRARVNGDGVRA